MERIDRQNNARARRQRHTLYGALVLRWKFILLQAHFRQRKDRTVQSHSFVNAALEVWEPTDDIIGDFSVSVGEKFINFGLNASLNVRVESEFVEGHGHCRAGCLVAFRLNCDCDLS